MWREFKTIIFFISKFFLVYILLTVLYSWYLQPYLYELKIADPFTTFTTELAVDTMKFFGFQAEHIQLPGEAYRRFILEGELGSIVNEGCNALSVMIIFVAFIVAFSRDLLTTSLYILLGLVMMFITNVGRIALLTYIYRFFPDNAKMAHDYLFPAIIYGMVVLLWLIWVKFFAFKK